MIASLPMYDWPELRPFTDAFWHRLQPALKAVSTAAPAELVRANLQKQWQSDELLLSQTCGYPLITSLPESTVVVGTPIYQCEFFVDGFYASPILVRQSDNRQDLSEFKGSTLAYNGTESQSGFNALKTLLVANQHIDQHQPGFFSDSVLTGSHRNAMQAVATNKADLCAVDPVSWALAQRFDVETKQLRVLTHTAFSPALPLVTNAKAIPHTLRERQWRDIVMDAFQKAIDKDTKRQLLLSGIRHIPKTQYSALPISNLDMITP